MVEMMNGVKKLMVEKSPFGFQVEKSGVGNFMVEKFTAEKLGVEKSGG